MRWPLLLALLLPLALADDWVVMDAGGSESSAQTPSPVLETVPYWWPLPAVPVIIVPGGGGGGHPLYAAYDLTLKLRTHSVRLGDTLTFDVYLSNTGSQLDSDATLSWWLTDPNGTIWFRGSQALLVPPGLMKLTKTTHIPLHAVPGEWHLHAQLSHPAVISATAQDSLSVRSAFVINWTTWLILLVGITLLTVVLWRRRPLPLTDDEQENDDSLEHPLR